MTDRNNGTVTDGRNPDGTFAQGNPSRPKGTRLKVTRTDEELLDRNAESPRRIWLQILTASEKQRTTPIRRRCKLPNATAARNSATGVCISRLYELSMEFATRVSKKKTIWCESKRFFGSLEAAPNPVRGIELRAAKRRASQQPCTPWMLAHQVQGCLSAAAQLGRNGSGATKDQTSNLTCIPSTSAEQAIRKLAPQRREAQNVRP